MNNDLEGITLSVAFEDISKKTDINKRLMIEPQMANFFENFSDLQIIEYKGRRFRVSLQALISFDEILDGGTSCSN